MALSDYYFQVSCADNKRIGQRKYFDADAIVIGTNIASQSVIHQLRKFNAKI